MAFIAPFAPAHIGFRAARFPIVCRVGIGRVLVFDGDGFRRHRVQVVAPEVGSGGAAAHRVVISGILLGPVLQFRRQFLATACGR